MYEKPYINSKIDKRLLVLGDIIEWSKHSNEFEIIGKSAFLKLNNGNNIKISCRDDSLVCWTINRTGGEVDKTELPFECYFAPVRCSANAPWWTPCIDGNDWRYPNEKHCHPKEDDFATIAEAIDDYVNMFN